MWVRLLGVMMVTTLAIASVGALGQPASSPTGAAGTWPRETPVASGVPDRAAGESRARRDGAEPLAGVTIVLDPGHQLGNRNHPKQISRLVPAGGFRKPCNTVGTSTDEGFPEATFSFKVAQRVAQRLRRQGAKVRMTRTSNRADRWGPCVDVRGRAGNKVGADLKVSIHADGHHAAGARGFHVIAPTKRRGWTDDIHRPSRRLALDLRRALRRAGLPDANYIAGGDGLDFRGDLGTLNLSDVPTVMVELGNMRHPGDATQMTSRKGRAIYVRALVRGMRRHLDR
ncbi:N-acetylmuramoyl-L-alanine amidase [Nocardioides sp.]|uniref:N-acetylmuramoyl-L-alanine amidase n=1 Tax=Nocardioides sp. TaxID=35761 RepID=UPI0027329D9D|nr:N-acetylmuramoyl-L-alanine amidase [Nocardioides sp.]MDP3891939.1 N-acetylmuramoyl-L-alanine amidase [Nocardioides sp.]